MKIFWKAYAILFILISLSNLLNFIQDDSPARLYYLMMLHFHQAYSIFYWLNIFNLIVTCASSLIVLCYAFNMTWAKQFTLGLLLIRILSEIFGHHYDLKTIQGAFAQDAYSGFITIAALSFIFIPSYIAHVRYTFK